MSPESTTLRVLIVDDHILFAEGLRKLLEISHEVVGVVENGHDLMSRVEATRPDVVVMDISMPHVDGIEATQQLKSVHPDLPVVVLSMHAEAPYVKAALDAGAAAYLLKTSDSNELLFALEQVQRGHLYVTPSLIRVVMDRSVEAIRVLVADDDDTTRYAIASILDTFDDLQVIGHAKDGFEAMQQAAELEPDVILMDLQMPGKDGVEATREILAVRSIPILALTGVTVTERIVDAVRAGALGYLAKGAPPQEIAHALRQVYMGNRWLPPNITKALVHQGGPTSSRATLTARELEIVRLVAVGLQNKEISGRLHVSDVTVRTHLRNIFEKLSISNRVELTLYALRAGWANLDDLE